MKIASINSLEILDSRGNPTVRTFLSLDNGATGTSSVPSGASTGSHEAIELRDNDPKRYLGKGVIKAINNIIELIAPKLINVEFDQPEKIDQLMIELDGTPNKSRLGANAILSVSQALTKATARAKKLPLWQFLNEEYFSDKSPGFPKLMLNVINGGRHANWNFDIQEFIVIPSFQLASESLKAGEEIYQTIKKNLQTKNLSTLVGDEGGFSPLLKTNEEVFQLIIESAKQAGYQNDKHYRLAIDAAATEFYQSGKYHFKKENKSLSAVELIEYYNKLKKDYLVYSYEDPFAENDWESFKKFTNSDNNMVVVGDDIYTTDQELIKKGISEKTTNAVLIKPNQIGTIYETVLSIKSAQEAGWRIAISHRSGETEDSFIADLSFACAADFLKSGAPARSERLAKYNRLLEIENEL